MKKINIDDRVLIKLRAQGLSYEQIADYFSVKGVEVCTSTIRNRLRKIFEEQRENPPTDATERLLYVDDDKIYVLRKQGKTYKDIAKYFIDNGINISSDFIEKRCKRIFQERGEEEPTVKVPFVSDEALVELTELGFNFTEISKYFAEEGILIPISSVSKRCNEIYKRKGMTVPKIKRGWRPLACTVINKKAIEKAFYMLMESRRVTDMQLKILAKEYNIQWDYVLDADNFENVEDEER